MASSSDCLLMGGVQLTRLRRRSALCGPGALLRDERSLVPVAGWAGLERKADQIGGCEGRKYWRGARDPVEKSNNGYFRYSLLPESHESNFMVVQP
jgi:hypothetical protein